MTALTADCTDTTHILYVDNATAPVVGSVHLIEDELILFGGAGFNASTGMVDGHIWFVTRGIEGTTAASHLSTTTVTMLEPQFGTEAVDTGGGGLPDGVSWDGTTLTGTAPAALQIYGGDSTDGAGGTAILSGGYGLTDTVVSINADVFAHGGRGNGDGGDLTLDTGAAGTGSDGHGGDAVLNLGAGDGLGRDGLLILNGLPTADPEIAGAVYSDGAPSGGVPKALMISGGPA